MEGWIEGAARTEDAKRPRIDGEAWDWAGTGMGMGLGEPLDPQQNFENSYLKPCILII